MTRIDFYLLPDSSAGATDDKFGVVCRLAEKAYRLGHAIYVLTPDVETSQKLDELLWVFNPGSFLPHALHDDKNTEPGNHDRVLLGHTAPPPAMHEILISLAPEVPPFFSSFQRLIELVGNDAGDKAQSRERFRFYRDRGYDLHTHNL